MKRKLTAVFSVIALLLLASCGTDTPADGQDGPGNVDGSGVVVDTNTGTDMPTGADGLPLDSTETPAE